MRTATVALNQTNNVTSSLLYIDSLVTAATAQGQYHIVVGTKILNDAMISQLVSSYGYKVTAIKDNMGDYTTYLIAW